MNDLVTGANSAAQTAEPLALRLNDQLGPAPRWWHCDTHGPGNHTAWGCPECVREMRADLATLRAREKACATMDDAQKVSLVRALQECCDTLGLHAMASPADLVREVAGLRKQMTALLLLAQEVRLIDAHGATPDGAPWHWNLLHGVDRADMLAFGRACMEAERERCAALCEAHTGMRGTGAWTVLTAAADRIRDPERAKRDAAPGSGA